MKTPAEFKNSIVDKTVSIEHCLSILNSKTRPTLFIVEDNNRLLGTLTDGDIRRALLNGIGIKEPVTRAMQSNPIISYSYESRDVRYARIRENNILSLPVVDKSRMLVGLEIINSDEENLPNTAVLMCGGLGSRMGELTKECPKPMLKINGTPMLEKILCRLVRCGIRNFIFAINYLGEMIEEYFGDGEKWNVCINYLHEDRRLGTGGALSLIEERPSQAMIVMNADILTDFDIRNILDFHIQTHSSATMGIVEHHYQNPYGVVRHHDSKLIGIDEKPIEKWNINSGIYVIEPELIDIVPKKTFIDMPDILLLAMKAGKLITVFPLLETWADIGRKPDYLKAQVVFQS